MTELLARWKEKLAGGPQAEISDSSHKQGSREWVDNKMCRQMEECGLMTQKRVIGLSSYFE